MLFVFVPPPRPASVLPPIALVGPVLGITRSEAHFVYQQTTNSLSLLHKASPHTSSTSCSPCRPLTSSLAYSSLTSELSLPAPELRSPSTVSSASHRLLAVPTSFSPYDVCVQSAKYIRRTHTGTGSLLARPFRRNTSLVPPRPLLSLPIAHLVVHCPPFLVGFLLPGPCSPLQSPTPFDSSRPRTDRSFL